MKLFLVERRNDTLLGFVLVAARSRRKVADMVEKLSVMDKDALSPVYGWHIIDLPMIEAGPEGIVWEHYYKLLAPPSKK